MEYRKIKKLLDNTPTEHITSISQIKFKTAMLKATACDYSEAYILLKETTTVTGQRADAAAIASDINNISHKLIIPKILMLQCQCII